MTQPCTNVADYLLTGKEPDRIALRFLSQEISYGKLESETSAVADYLLQVGAAKGERVVILGDNSLFWVAAYLGTIRAGLVAVPLPGDASVTDFNHIVRSVHARILFAEAGAASRLRDHLYGLHLVTDRRCASVPQAASQHSLLELELRPRTSGREFPITGRNELAALMFTSGSTGRPRGVMVSHANIIANTESIIEYLRLTHEDRIMTILPFHYCFGASLLHSHLRVGGSLVIDPRFAYPEAILQRMKDTRCTGFAGVPSHYQILLRRSTLRAKSFPDLRYVQQAGGHLAPAFARELREALPATEIFVMYGQTEATARLAYLPPSRFGEKIGSIGKAIPGVKLTVLHESGEQVRVGEVGEIVAEGANITGGYWGDPAETAKTFRDGKLFTGDLATLDGEGYIFIVDRVKSFLKCGGRRVSTRQLEELMLEFQPLQEVAVIGVQDDILGEAVKAFVVPRDSEFLDLENKLLQHCRERMPQEFVPKQIVVLQALPKNSTGKVLKTALKELEATLSAESQPVPVQ
jgi:acyl-CoA synthetase (AMP-forming)/AMP-acid ligase II